MYHDLSEDCDHVPPSHKPYVLDPSIFRRQMSTVAATKLTILMVAEWAAGARPPRALVLTFDDGHASNYTVALSILLEHRLKATFFITAGCIGTGETMNW